MTYLLEHASEILKLSISLALFGLFGVFLNLVRTLSLLNKILKKIDDLSDLFIEYIQTPLSYIIKFQKFFSNIINKYI